MTTKVKAKDLREGDKILLDDGTKATVVRNRQVKIKIPARYVKQQRLILESNRRKDGVAKKRTDVDTAWDGTEYEIELRTDFKSKCNYFMEQHTLYVNAIAGTFTGIIITAALTIAEVVTTGGAYALLAATLGVGIALTAYAYRNS